MYYYQVYLINPHTLQQFACTVELLPVYTFYYCVCADVLILYKVCWARLFLHNLHFLQSTVDPEQVALLVKHEWKLAYVTPLYRFQHTQLKLYSRLLTAFLVAEKQQGVAVEVGLEAGFKVTISTVLGMAETEDDAETVFIQVN